MSQTLRQAIVAKLNSEPTITSLLGVLPSNKPGIFTTAIPQTWDYQGNGPALAVVLPTARNGKVLVGSDGTKLARVQIDIFSYTQVTSDQLVEAIRDVFDQLPNNPWGDGSVQIMTCNQQDDGDSGERPEAGTDQWQYNMRTEYDVKYRVSVPSVA